ncbi:DUF305 domain-containing protein [Actinoplanes sp. N902-109]|uniref:DUF305 domain-containing protein n=1 Tax=Actinoplanes sp. (strain N902-109) TaxID=649831 RepID=UPI0003293E12|nr:DUF305 domain-containing protein [Actinoplanes sp. N902-109]AGL19775.1 hypothetical protein L083_6265 [Actinoplanes sp. N902-109]
MNRHSTQPRLNRRATFAAGWAVLTAVAAAACSGGDAATTSAQQPAAAVASGGGAQVFGGTDIAWIEITIAMDEQLLPLLALVPTHSSNAQLKALIGEVTATHQQELGTLRALHDEAKLPAENPHEGMPMPGMVTPEQVTAAAAQNGPAFDKLVVTQLKAHLDQGVNLAGSEGKAGVEPRTKKLAENVLSSRRTYLSRLAEFD